MFLLRRFRKNELFRTIVAKIKDDCSLDLTDQGLTKVDAGVVVRALRWHPPTASSPPILEILILSGNTMSDQGVVVLADELAINTTLRELTLAANQIGIVGAQSLANSLKSNASLVRLSLANNQIQVAGAKAIGSMLRHNRTLLHLSVAHNNVFDEGAIAIAEALLENTTLLTLDLDGNGICSDGAQAFLEAITTSNATLLSLSLEDNVLIRADTQEQIAQALREENIQERRRTSLQRLMNEVDRPTFTDQSGSYFGIDDSDDSLLVPTSSALSNRPSYKYQANPDVGTFPSYKDQVVTIDESLSSGGSSKVLWEDFAAPLISTEISTERGPDPSGRIINAPDPSGRIINDLAVEMVPGPFQKWIQPKDTAIVTSMDDFHDLTFKNVDELSFAIHYTTEWECLPAFRHDYSLNRSYATWGEEHFLAVGGRMESGEVSRSVEVYDFERRYWADFPELNLARHSSSCIVVDDVLYVFGGFGPDGVALDQCEKINLLQLEFGFQVIERRLPEIRANMGIGRHGNWIYLVGGNYNPTTTSVVGFERVEEEFVELGDMDVARTNACVHVEDEGFLLIAGGDNDGAVPSFELFDVNVGATRNYVDLPGFINRFAAFVVGNTFVLRDSEREVQIDKNLVLNIVDPDDVPSTVRSDSLSVDSFDSDDCGFFTTETLIIKAEPSGKLYVRSFEHRAANGSPTMTAPWVNEEKVVKRMDEMPLVVKRMDEMPLAMSDAYIRSLCSDELTLVRWISELARFELKYRKEVTATEIAKVKFVSRFYHFLVPAFQRYYCRANFPTKTAETVFVSHTGAQKLSYASTISEYLTDNGISNFLDQDSLRPGATPRNEMLFAALNCRCMWCVLSEQFVDKPYPLRELFIGYTRYHREFSSDEPSSFCLILDCFEEGKCCGTWLEKVLNLQSLAFYDPEGEVLGFPTMLPSINNESHVKRCKRIAGTPLANGSVLVKTVAASLPTQVEMRGIDP